MFVYIRKPDLHSPYVPELDIPNKGVRELVTISKDYP